MALAFRHRAEFGLSGYLSTAIITRAPWAFLHTAPRRITSVRYNRRVETMTDERADHPRSFQGEALEGSDFTGSDLRSADFSNADLRSASFREAALGVRPAIGAVILGLGMVFAVAAGVAIGWAANGTTDRLSADAWDERAEGGSLILILILLVALILWRGLDTALKVVVVAYPVLIILNVAANLIWEEVEYVRIVNATALIIFLVLAIAAGIFGRVVGGVFGSWSIAVVAVLGGLASGEANGGISGIIVALCLVFIAKRAVRGDDRDASTRRMAQRLVRRWGTRFVGADLTGADFTGTNASRCDVRGATLQDVRWDPDHARPVDAPG
jgi:hypothetical protein